MPALVAAADLSLVRARLSAGAYLTSGCDSKSRVWAETQIGSAAIDRTLIEEAPEFFTGGFDEQEQAVTIMKGEVFSRDLALRISLLVRRCVIRAMLGSLPELVHV